MVRNPELRFADNGTATCRFSVAVNKRWKKNEEWFEQTSYFECFAFGELAKNIDGSCIKGTPIIVSGQLQQRLFETPEKKGSVTEIHAHHVGLDLSKRVIPWGQSTSSE
jgi:single-strand DNA-binding protein